MQETIMALLNAIDGDLWRLLFNAFIGLALYQVARSFSTNLAIYLRLRFSDLFSKRTVIIYDDFEGVIEEISLSGIFIRNREGVTKYVPINRWYMGSIKYPNNLD